MNDMRKFKIAERCGCEWKYLRGDTIFHYKVTYETIELKARRQNRRGSYGNPTWLIRQHCGAKFAAQFAWASKWSPDLDEVLANWGVSFETGEPRKPLSPRITRGYYRRWCHMVGDRLLVLNVANNNATENHWWQVHDFNAWRSYDHESSKELRRRFMETPGDELFMEFVRNPGEMTQVALMEASL